MLYPAELPGPDTLLDCGGTEGGRFAGKGREVKVSPRQGLRELRQLSVHEGRRDFRPRADAMCRHDRRLLVAGRLGATFDSGQDGTRIA